MITKKDLQEAIAECHGVRHPNANTCVKLAAFYTIMDHIEERPEDQPRGYSYQAPPRLTDEIIYTSGSEFAEAINGKDPQEIWPIIDELMAAIQVLQPKLYAAVLRKIKH